MKVCRLDPVRKGGSLEINGHVLQLDMEQGKELGGVGLEGGATDQ